MKKIFSNSNSKIYSNERFPPWAFPNLAKTWADLTKDLGTLWDLALTIKFDL